MYFGAKENGIESFVGGGTWQSFAWAIWEQVTGFSLIIGLLGLFKKYFNSQGVFTQNLSASAYGVFIIHPPVIVGISAIFVHWEINQLLKLIALAPVALTVTFLIAWLLKQIPGLKSIV